MNVAPESAAAAVSVGPSGGDENTQAARASWRVVVVLSLGAFASSGMARVLDPLLPRLEHVFGVSLSQAAWGLTSFAVVYGVMQVVYGPLADRRGKLQVLRWSSALAALAALACAWEHTSIWPFVVARAAAGAFCAASIPLAIAWIGDNVPLGERKTVLARFMIGQMAGMASGQLLGGLSAEHAFWSWPFLVYGTLYIVVAVALWMTRDARRAHTDGAGSSPLDALRMAMTSRIARVVLAATFAEGLIYLGAFSYLATHLHREGHLALSSAGMLVMGFSAGGVAFAVTAGRWIGRVPEGALILFGGGLAALTMVLVALLPTVWVTAPAMVVGGLGFYMLHNALQAHATQMLPTRRGAAIALFATCFFLGQSSGVTLMGYVSDHWGTTVSLIAGGVGLFLLCLALRRGLRGPQF